MAIAFDAASTAKGNTTPLAWSHICTGSDLILIVGVSALVKDVVSVTYNSVPLSLVGTKTTSQPRVELWYLVAPSTGANTIEVTLGGDTNIVAGATSWTGVDQSTPLGVFVSATGTSTAPTVTASTSAGDEVVDVLAAYAGPSAAADGSQTERWDDAVAGTIRGASSNESSGDGNVVMSWTLGSSQVWTIGAVPIKAGGGGGGAGETTLTEVWVIPSRTEPLNIGGTFGTGILAQAMATKYPHLLAWRVDQGRFVWHDLGPLFSSGPLDAMAIAAVPIGGASDLGSMLFGVESHTGVVLTSLASSTLGDAQRRYPSTGGFSTLATGILFGSREEFPQPHRLTAIRIWGEDFQQADNILFAYRWDRQRWYDVGIVSGLPAEVPVTDSASGMFLEWLIGFRDANPWEPSPPAITRLDVLVEPVKGEPQPEADSQTPTID